MPAPDPLPPEFWQSPLADLQTQLGSSPEGLGEAEAGARRRTYGANLMRPRAERAWILQFLAHFRNPLVLELLAASAISGMLGDIKSFVVISVIVMMSVTLDFFQEFRASRAVEKLRHSVALRAKVVRGGQTREIPVAELVPGDVVLLAAGDLAPAAGRVLDARDLFVSQALLTGESYPVEKHAQD